MQFQSLIDGGSKGGGLVNPDLEVVAVGGDQSFKIWTHGYPFRTVRWHFHPEYELHLVTETKGHRYVGDHIGAFRAGDLVFVGPNLPHNWISNVPSGKPVQERCLVLQFADKFIRGCIALFPELRFLEQMLNESHRGILFDAAVAERAEPLMRHLLVATGGRRIELFIAILDLIAHAAQRLPLASIGFQTDPPAYLSTTMNLVLQHIGCNFTNGVSEADLAKLSGQSISTFSRSFRKHTGMTFVHYVNARRIELACQYLSQAELSVTGICYEVGFRNISNFNRQFLALKGMPPSRFRSLQRAGRYLAAAA